MTVALVQAFTGLAVDAEDFPGGAPRALGQAFTLPVVEDAPDGCPTDAAPQMPGASSSSIGGANRGPVGGSVGGLEDVVVDALVGRGDRVRVGQEAGQGGARADQPRVAVEDGAEWVGLSRHFVCLLRGLLELFILLDLVSRARGEEW